MAERVYHGFEPVFNVNSRVLVLGTMPSVLSRQQRFYYGNPHNRFWKVLAALCQEAVPETIEEKRLFLLRKRIAVWDVIDSCEIEGSSDASIKGEIVNDMNKVLAKAPIERIYANGSKAWQLYRKHCIQETGREIVKLPSTSPANAACSLEKLCKAWTVILERK